MPGYAIGWEVGDVRTYKFYGIEVKAEMEIEDGYRRWILKAFAFGAEKEQDCYNDQEIETAAEELAGDLAVRVLKDGDAVLCEVRR